MYCFFHRAECEAHERDALHNLLGAGGMLPFIGILFDGADALLHIGQGDFIGAGMAVAFAVPGLGDAARAGKYAVSAAAGSDELVEIFRAVGPNELADIRLTGHYRPGGISVNGKYFYPTAQQVTNFVEMASRTKLLAKPYTMSSTIVRRSDLPKPIDPVKEGLAYFFEADKIPQGAVKIFE
jgi:hypothetical protein